MSPLSRRARASLFAALALAGALAQAACLTDDAWVGPDKQQHLLAGAAIGSLGALLFQSASDGFALGVAAGVLKEARDSAGFGTCSLQDAVVTAAGSALGAFGASFALRPTSDGQGLQALWKVSLD